MDIRTKDVWSNDLILALSKVAGHLSISMDLDQIMRILGEELKKLKITFVVAVVDRDSERLSIRYHSIDSEKLLRVEKVIGKKIEEIRIVKRHFSHYFDHEQIQNRGVISDIEELTSKFLPDIPTDLVAQVLCLFGLKLGSRAIDFPLLIDQRVLGILGIWGSNLNEGDIPSLSVFASQVTIALENARLFDQVCLARERLQNLSRRLVEVHEVERRSLARELHDEVGQILTGVKFLLRTDEHVHPSQQSKNLLEAQELVDDLMRRVRELSLELRPQMLDDLGLLPALIWQIDRFTAQTRVNVDFKHRGIEQKRFPPVTETTVFRIVQEALTNTARHAHVQDVGVQIVADQNQLRLEIEDRGIGFDPDVVAAMKVTEGLAGMRERANVSGGTFELMSTPCQGTRLVVTLPVIVGGLIERRKRGR